MRNRVRSTTLVMIAALLAISAKADLELPLQKSYEPSAEPLTTEQVWSLDAEILNPHRTRWVLSRLVDLTDLRAVKKKNGSYGIQTAGLYSKSVSHVRMKSPIYSEIEDFPCTAEPQDWFATEEGTRLAADVAAKKWDEALSHGKFKLELLLKRVQGEFPENAMRTARATLAVWRDDVESQWKTNGLREARAEEWKFYQKFAAENGICSRGTKKEKFEQPRRWEALMEFPPDSGATPKLIARAPARRWGGLFSVLVGLKVGDKEVLGKFLIDSAAPQSMISPNFLENQGALPSWVEIPHGKAVKIHWSGGSGVAKPAFVKEVKIGGTVLSIHDFFLHDTDFFGPPESFSSCCDGVLGADFLRDYAVEFRTGKGPELNLYAREKYRAPAGYPWVETHFDSAEQIVSDCVEIPSGKDGADSAIRGVRWDTGNELALEIAQTKRLEKHWDMKCGDLMVAREVASEAKQDRMSPPPPNAGMELLGRGDFIFDLGHGRIWFNPQGLLIPIVQNHSGLNLEYFYIDGERMLKVIGIQKGSPAEALRKAGLSPGIKMVSIDSKSVDDMDTWEVEQRLSGVYGGNISLEWKTGKKSTRIAPLKLPRLSP